MTPEELEAIERRAEAATEGPWTWQLLDSVMWLRDDAKFIAHARTDIPALCAALREAWGEIRNLKEYRDDTKRLIEGLVNWKGGNTADNLLYVKHKFGELESENARLKQCCDEAAKTCARQANRIKELEGRDG